MVQVVLHFILSEAAKAGERVGERVLRSRMGLVLNVVAHPRDNLHAALHYLHSCPHPAALTNTLLQQLYLVITHLLIISNDGVKWLLTTICS